MLPLEIQLYRRDCWDPINVCLYMFCRWRSIYIEEKVGIPLKFVYICFSLEFQLYRRDCWDLINVCLYMFCRWSSSYIEGIVGIPLTFFFICFAVGDPVI